MLNAEFDEILLSNAAFLKPFTVNLMHDQDAANDLYQETLYKALANKDKYHAGTNIKAWLYTIMRNIFINHYRRRSKQQVIFDSTPNEFLLNQHKNALVNSGVASIGLKEIQVVVHRLPNMFRLPFQLYFDGYKYQEIAAMLGEPLGTIKSRIHFARKLLRRQIRRY